ncbi:hypothetical protein GCK72_014229 [Caenorhabditis remanei]|uniref:Sdz-33 F-box domain-containing protein n=1 Tax=Caenorhabditis remanei TaxID=31234 RepID=A0A6A5GTH3_CAERE|nr:hypothetical protein GCK72_014229 [Caenorhabditis remanei]KAF1757773.1 hypothetical protein GCK72_014229 [Caenorhabditis remanei]
MSEIILIFIQPFEYTVKVTSSRRYQLDIVPPIPPSLIGILVPLPYIKLDFSFISKRCRLIVKSTNLGNYDIGMSFRPDQYLIRKRNKYINAEVKPYLDDRKEISLKFAKVWVEYVCDLFRIGLNFLLLNSSASIEHMSSVAEWMNSICSNVCLCDISGDDVNSDSVTRFFEKATFSINVLVFELRQEYEISPIHCGVLNIDQVVVSTITTKTPCSWFTVDQVLTSNCITMMIGACTFGERDLNRIIKSWISGNNPRMEFFHAVVYPLDFELVLDGIEFEKRDLTLIRRLKIPFLTKQIEYTFFGGFDIRRQDGTVATIQQMGLFETERIAVTNQTTLSIEIANYRETSDGWTDGICQKLETGNTYFVTNNTAGQGLHIHENAFSLTILSEVMLPTFPHFFIWISMIEPQNDCSIRTPLMSVKCRVFICTIKLSSVKYNAKPKNPIHKY